MIPYLQAMIGYGQLPAGSDPGFSSVTALLHNDAAGFPDVKGNTVTVGNATLSSTWSKFGGKSMAYSGGSAAASMPNPMSGVGTGPFTIEFFCRPGTVGGTQRRIISFQPGTGQLYIIGITVGGKFFAELRDNTGAPSDLTLTGTTTVVVNTEYFVQLLRKADGTTQLAINGAVEASGAWASKNLSASGTMYFGSNAGSSEYSDGYIDEFRVSMMERTVALPTSAFPDS